MCPCACKCVLCFSTIHGLLTKRSCANYDSKITDETYTREENMWPKQENDGDGSAGEKKERKTKAEVVE